MLFFLCCSVLVVTSQSASVRSGAGLPLGSSRSSIPVRQVLVDDLGYTMEEADLMEDDVAAVVTARGLVRPSAGMPMQWRRPSQRPHRFSRATGALGAVAAMPVRLSWRILQVVWSQRLLVSAAGVAAACWGLADARAGESSRGEEEDVELVELR